MVVWDEFYDDDDDGNNIAIVTFIIIILHVNIYEREIERMNVTWVLL